MVIRKAMKSDGAALDALLTKLIRDETRYDSNLSPEVVIKRRGAALSLRKKTETLWVTSTASFTKFLE